MYTFYRTVFVICGIGAGVLGVWTIVLCLYLRIWSVITALYKQWIGRHAGQKVYSGQFLIEREIMFVHTEETIDEKDHGEIGG